MAATREFRVRRASPTAPAAGPIDHAHLARYTFGNQALEIEVLRLFADQAPVTLEQLREARSGKAWRDVAHTLKGSARAVGAFEVACRAEKAEALAGSGDAEARQVAVDALSDALLATALYIARLELASGVLEPHKPAASD